MDWRRMVTKRWRRMTEQLRTMYWSVMRMMMHRRMMMHWRMMMHRRMVMYRRMVMD